MNNSHPKQSAENLRPNNVSNIFIQCKLMQYLYCAITLHITQCCLKHVPNALTSVQ